MKPSLHGFEFRFHKKVSNGYRSATKGLGSLLKADKGHSQVWKFVLVCCRVTSTSRHALGKENTVLTRCLKILTNIPKYETLMRQNPRRPLPAKASRVSKFPSALHAPRLIATHYDNCFAQNKFVMIVRPKQLHRILTHDIAVWCMCKRVKEGFLEAEEGGRKGKCSKGRKLIL